MIDFPKPEINKNLIRRWVDALRSGKYTQGKMRLRNRDNSMCCLGVLCDVSRKGSWVQAGEEGDFIYVPFDSDYHLNLDKGDGLVLPNQIANAVGIAQNPKISSLYNPEWMEARTLSNANDVAGLTFAEIADAVEKEYLTPEPTPAYVGAANESGDYPRVGL